MKGHCTPWFAWFPVKVLGEWHWLKTVARDQWSNKPSRYRYGIYHSKPDPKNYRVQYDEEAK